MSRRLVRVASRLVGLALLVVVPAAAAHAEQVQQPVLSGPTITLDRSEAAVGENVRVSISGFEAAYVTVSVCGNEARRGSSDCSTTGSVSVEVHHDGTETWTVFPVSTPPFGCPCAIRVFSSLNDEVGVVPFTVTGHPVEPVQSGRDLNQPLVAVSVEPLREPDGVIASLRSSLGGPTNYAVEVVVKNLTSEVLSNVALSGSVGRGESDELAALDLVDPGSIGPGQSSTQTVNVMVPSPTFGTFNWRVTASGAGPSVTTIATARPRPWLLILAVLAIVLIVALLIIRVVVLRRLRRAASAQGDATLDDRVAGEHGVTDLAA
ncbi:MAG: hypothetical protein HY828_10525 [Actinobacteria bacterium]|nr:hypothetical protein [Actinomycetota bacterium]